MPPKSKQYGVTVVLVDVGSQIGDDLEKSRQAADWIFARKIFSESTEKMAIAAFGSKVTQNSLDIGSVQVHSEILENASFDQLRFINRELEINPKKAGSVGCGLTVAVEIISNHEKDNEGFVNDRTIVLITNSKTNRIEQKRVEQIAEMLRGIDLMIIGPKDPETFPLKNLVDEVGAQVYDYDLMIKQLAKFVPKKTETRNIYKQFEIGPGLRLPLAFTTKSVKTTSSGLKFSLVDGFGSNVVRVSQLNVQNESGATQTFAQLPKSVFEKNCDQESFRIERASEKTSPKELSKGELCSGAFFGKTLIFFDDDEVQNQYNGHKFNDGEKGGCLKLMQFTKKVHIDSSYFLGDRSYTVMPAVTKATSAKNLNTTRCTLSLIESMLELDVVAICRYAYSVSSHLQIMALIPHYDEDIEVAYLRAVRLPFADDMRCLKFPEFGKSAQEMMFNESDETKPTVSHLSAIDDLIDMMQFDDETVAKFTTGKVPDPQLQLQCHFLRDKALNPEISTQQHLENAMSKVEKFLKPKEEMNSGIFKRLSEEFNLNRVVKQKRRRIELDKEDMQNLIDEWKSMKKSGKSREKEEIEVKFERDANNSAIDACKGAIKTIGAMCLIPDRVSREQCFEVIHTQILEIRQQCIKHEKFETFNEFLSKLRDEDDYEEFRDFVSEKKMCPPISRKDVASAILTEFEAIEFWDE